MTLRKIAVAAAVLTLLGAGSVHAQDASSSAPSDAPSDEEILTAAIGCIATYDTVVAQGKAGNDAAKIRAARDFAVEVYKEYSKESDEEVAADIKYADEAMPGLLADGKTTLEEFRAVCDAVFVDEPAPAAPTT